MATQLKYKLTSEEYLAIERAAEIKSEFYNGEMFAMAGASRAHVIIVGNLAAELRQQLKKRPCNVYSTDLRLRVEETGLYTYPDIMVACEQQLFADNQKDTLLNPKVIIEVLSDSTKDYDRGGKFAHYRKLASLHEYILVAQDEPHVEQYIRQPDSRWMLSETDDITSILHLSSIDCDIPLAEIYDKVEFNLSAPENSPKEF